MTHHIRTTLGLALFICAALVIIISCSKEPGKSTQSTNKVESAAGRDTAVTDASCTLGKKNTKSAVLTKETAANKVEVKELIEQFNEEYRRGGGRSAKTMQTVRYFQSLRTNDALSVEQKMRMTQGWIANHMGYIGAQGALFCLYSNIIHDTRASAQDRATALQGCGEIYLSFYHDGEAQQALQMALSGYEQENNRLQMARTLGIMGELYAEHQNNEEQALACFQKALEYGTNLQDYDPANAQQNAIGCLIYLNRLEDAERLVNEFIKANPNNEWLQKQKTDMDIMKGPPAMRSYRGGAGVKIHCGDYEEIPGIKTVVAERDNLKTREFLRQMLNSLIKLEQEELK
ncbi:MAG: hypothetical protein NTV22_01125 [bacterium]|nr:hypothetical protein [bacterium]